MGPASAALCWILMQSGADAGAAAAPVEGVGSFHNFRFVGDQQSGFGVDVWRVQGKLLGVFIVAEGLPQPACAPFKLIGTGEKDDFTFTAIVGTGGGRESFTFTGRLKGDQASGTLLWVGRHSETTLKLKRDKGAALPDYPSMGHWERAELARCPAAE